MSLETRLRGMRGLSLETLSLKPSYVTVECFRSGADRRPVTIAEARDAERGCDRIRLIKAAKPWVRQTPGGGKNADCATVPPGRRITTAICEPRAGSGGLCSGAYVHRHRPPRL